MNISPDPAVAKKQLLAVLFYLTAFGHVDGDFDATERKFVRDRIAKLVSARIRASMPKADVLTQNVTAEKWTSQFFKAADAIDREIAGLFTESVTEGETSTQFVQARLALRCFELLRPFDAQGRAELFAVVEELVATDGKVHPAEQKLREEIQRLLDAPEVEVELLEEEEPAEKTFLVEPRVELKPRAEDNEFLSWGERVFSAERGAFDRQCEYDRALFKRVRAKLEEQRAAGAGKLAGHHDVRDFAGSAPFLDGHVYVLPPKPGKDYELIVLGDLHGCYSCLKAALQQTDFFAKVDAHHADPERAPDTRLVLLGDYIDRGRYSFDGVFRAAMHLFVTVPHAVYMLRGNHEYYLRLASRVLAPVRPAEAWTSLQGLASEEFLGEYLDLFETLPNMLAFDRILFVHAGIPRDDTLEERWKDLSSLNDSELRFQMLWSDPSEAEFVPVELQKSTTRFSFGSRQLRSFLARLGCNTVLRGHDRIVEGFRPVYTDPSASLYTLFSAGGAKNQDLPETSNYREVTPMGLVLRHRDGVTRASPFAIDYARYNDPTLNRLYAKE